MELKTQRSASQILFGYLPDQTVDLFGGVWKVKDWRTRYLQVDSEALRSELLRVVRPWEAEGTDNGFARRLRKGDPIRVETLDPDDIVIVDRFPEVYQCRSCNRIPAKPSPSCKCGASSWGQLHFVGYHSCGELVEPWIPRCKTHDDVKVVFPGSSDASQIRFECPSCNQLLRRGFGFPNCNCGTGKLTFNVHRAASVFTPRTVVIVNAMSPDKVRELRSPGGPERSLGWVLGGTEGDRQQARSDRAGLIADLVSKGIPLKTAEQMAALAEDDGAVADDDPTAGVPSSNLSTVLEEASTIASAMSDGRRTIQELIDGSPETEALGRKYRSDYLLATARAGLEPVDLIDRFPILTAQFGYTRGRSEPGASRLKTWSGKNGNRVIYADLQQTEALFIRLDPMKVHGWLRDRWPGLSDASSPEEARRVIVREVVAPQPGDEVDESTPGVDLLTLIHSYSHRVIRRAAVFAGLDRNSLGELLVPHHLGFFVFATARGEFVLGGLEAVFETDLDALMRDIVAGEHRCAMDPGCRADGGACPACLQIGEPSCRYFNRFLDRRVISGSGGYLL